MAFANLRTPLWTRVSRGAGANLTRSSSRRRSSWWVVANALRELLLMAGEREPGTRRLRLPSRRGEGKEHVEATLTVAQKREAEAVEAQ
jgi:hypothetical protein